MKQAFTLIELLVVVLIIGILSAIALPQYQKAVIKTRYATLKNMVNSIVQAQEVYYLANNSYSRKFENLDIDIGGSTPASTDYSDERVFPWGTCRIYVSNSTAYMRCSNDAIKMTYQVYPMHAGGDSGKRYCVSHSANALLAQALVCKAETGDTSHCGEAECSWAY